LATGGIFNTFDLINVGLILGVTPRISPEGMVVMEIDAENSSLAPEAEGIPVAISAGTVIRSPAINTTNAQTTVSAADGETILLGGLITKSITKIDNRVPLLADIPLLGNLFKYDSTAATRHELLIILTPHVVRTPAEAERIKRMESARMSWCLGDVEEIHGEGTGLKQNGGRADVIYPDVNPRGVVGRSALERIVPRGDAAQPPQPGVTPAAPPDDRNSQRSLPPEPVQRPSPLDGAGGAGGSSGSPRAAMAGPPLSPAQGFNPLRAGDGRGPVDGNTAATGSYSQPYAAAPNNQGTNPVARAGYDVPSTIPGEAINR
jgi:hypothetical protein